MRKQILFLLVLSFLTSSSYSQEYEIQGKIISADQEAIWLANVLLLSALDSILIDGSSTDEKGLFKITNIPPGDYLLKASYLENESDFLNLAINADLDIGTLTIANYAQVLDEVIVSTQKPRVERKVDRLVFNIGNTAFSDGDIWEALKRAPGVVVINNELSVNGSRDIGIMINGRKLNLPRADVINLLSGTTASNVESIEVITNPPAKYSAEGGMLINIIMKKNLISGYNGAVFNRYTQGVFPKHTVGTDHFFKGSKSSFSANYSFSNEKWLTKYTDVTNYIEDGSVSSIWTAEEDYIRKRKRHNFNAFFDYVFDDRNSLSFSTLNQYNPSVDRFHDSETQITDPSGVPDSSFISLNNSDEQQLNTSFYLDFVHKLQKKGAELSTNMHYTYYDYERRQDLNTDFFDVDGNLIGENDFFTNSLQQINLYSVQADYITPSGPSSKFETGLRYAQINSEGRIDQEGIDRNQAGIDPTESGVFEYDEGIIAGYASLDNKWDKWKLKVGLRGEHTKTMGKLNAGTAATNTNYFKLFPSFSIQYTQSPKHDYHLYYYRRITRPRYNSLNPFQVFQSFNSVIEGNPDLLPSTRHYMAGGYTFNRGYTFELFYKNRTNFHQRLVFQDNENEILRFISSNVDKDYAYGFNFSISKNFTNNWYFYFLASTAYMESIFTDLESGQLVESGLWNTYIRANSGLSFLTDKSLKADVSLLYSSPVIQGNSKQEAYSRVGITLRKTLWKAKGSISLGVADLFNKSQLFNTRKYLNQNNTSFYRPESRLLVMSFRYKFGNTKIRTNKKSKKVEERNRI
ncbi:MAG: TonB-dependent receptor [Maribacter sp.]|nr:TonB-dependent receptor [Maribacter sp.]